MPRRPRVETIGFHHIINRGVAREDIFLKKEDYKAFLNILHVSKSRYKFTVQSLCLMPNHYHLLIETTQENLSLIARQINSKYAQYFNKEYGRVGPLWQGRFKNWYVYDESYLYILFKYIEENPIKANISTKVGSYPWCSSTFALQKQYSKVLESSYIFTLLKDGFFDTFLNESDLEELQLFHKSVYKNVDKKPTRMKQTSLAVHFKNTKTIVQRNAKIAEALKDGYMQTEIAKYLKMTNANVCRILSMNTKAKER